MEEYFEEFKGKTVDITKLSSSQKKILIEKGKKPSHFYSAVYTLVKEFQKVLEKNPSAKKDRDKLWKERQDQMNILKKGLEGAAKGEVYDDTTLYKICEDLNKLANTKWFSPYNELKERLNDILEEFSSLKHVHLNTELNLQLSKEKSCSAQQGLSQSAIIKAKQKLLESFPREGILFETYLRETKGEEIITELVESAKNELINEIKKSVEKELATFKYQSAQQVVYLEGLTEDLAKVNLQFQTMTRILEKMSEDPSHKATIDFLKAKCPDFFGISNNEVSYDGQGAVKVNPTDLLKDRSTSNSPFFAHKQILPGDGGKLASKSDNEFHEIKL